jgi:hypothetical protein
MKGGNRRRVRRTTKGREGEYMYEDDGTDEEGGGKKLDRGITLSKYIIIPD